MKSCISLSDGSSHLRKSRNLHHQCYWFESIMSSMMSLIHLFLLLLQHTVRKNGANAFSSQSQGWGSLHGGATDGKGGPVEWLWGNWFVNIPVRIFPLLWKAILELISMKQKRLPLNVILSTSQTAYKQVTQLSTLQKGPGFSLDNGIFPCAKEDMSMTLHSTCDFSWWKSKYTSCFPLKRC